jgi:hypothetical protein
MAQDPNIDALHGLPEGAQAERVSESMGAARYLGEVVLGGVKAIFAWDATREFKAVNDNRARVRDRITHVVPDVRPDTPAEGSFAPEKISDVPPPVPVTRLSRFADEKLPVFDLRPAQPDILELDPLGLDTPLANDNTPPQTITRIRA